MKPLYTFKDGVISLKNAKKANPQKMGEELTDVSNSNGGRMHPAAVVERARSTESTLHKHFEWDDSVCGIQQRLLQARNIISIIRIKETEQEDPIPAFISIKDTTGTAYRTAGEIIKSEHLQLYVLQQANRDLMAFEKRYKELADICKQVKFARVTLEEKILAAAAKTAEA